MHRKRLGTMYKTTDQMKAAMNADLIAFLGSALLSRGHAVDVGKFTPGDLRDLHVALFAHDDGTVEKLIKKYEEAGKERV